MAGDVFVLGGVQTDFARNWSRTGGDLYGILEDVVLGALEDAEMPAGDVDVAHVGNLAAELFTGQAQLGGFVASLDPAFAMLPTARHEAACASGSVATLAAMSDLEAGRYDVALVTGVEMMRNVDSVTAAGHLGSAAWVGREAVDAEFPWPHLFSRIADVYAERHGLDASHLLRIAEINLTNARANPLAQTRDWQFPTGSFDLDDDVNPVVDGRLRKQDCGRITDGGAAVILAAGSYAEAWARQRGRSIDELARISGWGHRTAPMLLEDKVAIAPADGHLFPHVRRTITDAFDRANVPDVSRLDAIETHDCFTITEYMALDHFGITPPGMGWQAIEDGTIESSGSLPVNPSGGLIGLGHPVGATGVRMVLDASRQVTRSAGATQIDGARRVGTLNIGGSCTTAVAFVVETAGA